MLPLKGNKLETVQTQLDVDLAPVSASLHFGNLSWVGSAVDDRTMARLDDLSIVTCMLLPHSSDTVQQVLKVRMSCHRGVRGAKTLVGPPIQFDNLPS